MNSQEINLCTEIVSMFTLEAGSKPSSDGRKDENGERVNVRSILTCQGCKKCKAKIRQSRPKEGQGDDYIVLQTKGRHHEECSMWKKD